MTADDGTDRSVLGIVAGGGTLPGDIIRRCIDEGRPYFVLALKGFADPKTIEGHPHRWVRMGAAGEALRLAREHHVDTIVLAGRVSRPSITSLMPDATALRILGKSGLRLGDDGLLKSIVDYLEEREGLKVIGIHDILDDAVSVTPGPLGEIEPNCEAWGDIARGREVLDLLAKADVGQAVVVQAGLVLGMEAIEGTDALIARAVGVKRDGQGPVLVKQPKLGQEERVDLPTVGPDTVRRAVEAGFSGIAIRAGGVLVVDRGKLVEVADRAGLFIVAFDDESSGSEHEASG